jgi:hypothetical protein
MTTTQAEINYRWRVAHFEARYGRNGRQVGDVTELSVPWKVAPVAPTRRYRDLLATFMAV